MSGTPIDKQLDQLILNDPIGSTGGENVDLDDVWDTDEDVTVSKGTGDENTTLSLDVQRLRGIHSKQGYVEGLMESRERSTQRGNDEGYQVGSDLGFRVGRVLGVLQMLANICDGSEEVDFQRIEEDFKLAIRELNINTFINQETLRDGKKAAEVVQVVDRWEALVKKYCEKFCLSMTS